MKKEPERRLTPRQSEVLLHAANGYSNQRIASTLFVSVHTVKTLMRICFKKLNVQDRAQAVVVALMLDEIDISLIVIPPPPPTPYARIRSTKKEPDAKAKPAVDQKAV